MKYPEDDRTEREKQLSGNLVGDLQTKWSASKQAKQIIEQRAILGLDMYERRYSSQKASEIQAVGYPLVFDPIVYNKVHIVLSQIGDIVASGRDLWDVKPSPYLPEVNPDFARAIGEAIVKKESAAAAESTDKFDNAYLFNVINDITDKIKKEYMNQATEMSRRMGDVIEDQLQQGNFYTAILDVVFDAIVFPVGTLKGPVARKKQSEKFIEGDGGWETETQDEVSYDFEHVPFWDLFPSPASVDINKGYVFHRQKLQVTDLQALIGVPGYDEEGLRYVLNTYNSVNEEYRSWSDSVVEMKEDKMYQDIMASNLIWMLEFWGPLKGSLLLEYGVQNKKIADPDIYYECMLLIIGDRVIKAVINPGERPFSCVYYARRPNSIYGDSLPEILSGLQETANSLFRALIYNSIMSSGPQVALNKELLSPGQEASLTPHKIWQFTKGQIEESGALMQFFQPSNNTQFNLMALQRVHELADAIVQGYQGGNIKQAGAADTASGLQMLMDQSGKSIKMLLNQIDRGIIEPCIKKLYRLNMLHHPDNTIKGDCTPKATGSANISLKGQMIAKLRDAVAMTNNPVDMQLTGPQGRRELLSELFGAMSLDTDSILPPENLKELMDQHEQAKQQAQQQQQQAQMAGALQQMGAGGGDVTQQAQQTQSSQEQPINQSGLMRTGNEVANFRDIATGGNK